MTKYLSILACSMLLHIGARAQITILEDDAPKAGNTYNSQDLTSGFTGITTGNKGAGQSWDYSALSGGAADAIIYRTPTGSESTDFPNTTLVQYDGSTYNYFNVTADATYLIGEKDTINKKLSPPLLYTTFPVAYGNTTNGTSGVVIQEAYKTTYNTGLFTATIDSIRLMATITKNDTVDAWGTIKTPVSSYDAIRVFTSTAITFKVEAYVGSPALGWIDVAQIDPSLIPAPSYTREYNWWAKGIGIQVFQIIFNGQTGNEITNVNWYTSNTPTAVANALPESLVTLGPNPNNGNFNIGIGQSTSAYYNISVNDLAGKTAYTGTMNNGFNSFNLSTLTGGIYTIKITDDQGRSLVKRMAVTK
jgi:hypothetical protein